MAENSDDKTVLKELRDMTKDKNTWKENIDEVAQYIDEKYSVEVKAKALWLLGEIGLRHPGESEAHIDDIAFFMTDESSKLRERSANALGRIGRADKNLVIKYLDRLFELRYDESANVRHAFIWACENIAINAPEIFCDKLDIFFEMISDSSEKVRIEAPEMFRVIGKRKPDCVKPYLERLEKISENDENPTVRIPVQGQFELPKKALKIKCFTMI